MIYEKRFGEIDVRTERKKARETDRKIEMKIREIKDKVRVKKRETKGRKKRET